MAHPFGTIDDDSGKDELGVGGVMLRSDVEGRGGKTSQK